MFRFEVQSRQCESCIYRKDSPFDIKKLEAQIADKHMEGFFTGHRVCHHAPRRSMVCCRGFWDRHRDHFAMGQIAQRLKAVVFVTVDVIRKPQHAKLLFKPRSPK